MSGDLKEFEKDQRIEKLEKEVAELRDYVRMLGKLAGAEPLEDDEAKKVNQRAWFAESEPWREKLRSTSPFYQNKGRR